jgi:hypothetical protein
MERSVNQAIVRRTVYATEFADGTFDIVEMTLAPRKEGERLTKVARKRAAEEVARILRKEAAT